MSATKETTTITAEEKQRLAALLLKPINCADDLRATPELIQPQRLVDDILYGLFESAEATDVIGGMGEEAFERLQKVLLETMYGKVEALREKITTAMMCPTINLMFHLTDKKLIYVLMEYFLLVWKRIYCAVYDDKMVWKLLKRHCEIKEFREPQPGNPPAKSLAVVLKGTGEAISVHIPDLISKFGCQFTMGATPGSKSGKKTELIASVHIAAIMCFHAINAFFRDIFFDEFYVDIDPLKPTPSLLSGRFKGIWTTSEFYEWTQADEDAYWLFSVVYPSRRFTGKPNKGKAYYGGPHMAVTPDTVKAYEAAFWVSRMGWLDEMPTPKKDEEFAKLNPNAGEKRFLGPSLEYLKNYIPKAVPTEMPLQEDGESDAAYIARMKSFKKTCDDLRIQNEWWWQPNRKLEDGTVRLSTWDINRFIDVEKREFRCDMANYNTAFTNFSGVTEAEGIPAGAADGDDDKKKDDVPLTTRQYWKSNASLLFSSEELREEVFNKFKVKVMTVYNKEKRRNEERFLMEPPKMPANGKMYVGFLAGYKFYGIFSLTFFNNQPKNIPASGSTPELKYCQQFSIKLYVNGVFVVKAMPQSNSNEAQQKQLNDMQDLVMNLNKRRKLATGESVHSNSNTAADNNPPDPNLVPGSDPTGGINDNNDVTMNSSTDLAAGAQPPGDLPLN